MFVFLDILNNLLNFMNKFKAKTFFLAAAGISFLLSVTLWFTGSHDQGLYVGIWVPVSYTHLTLPTNREV